MSETTSETAPVETAPTEGKAAPETESSKAATETEAKPKVKPWFESRIDEITAKRREAERALEAANARAEQAEKVLREIQSKSTGDGTQSSAPALNEAQIREQVRREEAVKAAQELATAQFNETCNKIAQAGKRDYDDFDDIVKKLQTVEGLSPEMILAISDVDEATPQAVIHALGNNLDEALRIKGLPPVRQGQAIGRLAASLADKPKSKPKVSRAPEPITPIKGSADAEVDLYDENVPYERWLAARERHLEAKRKRA